MSIEFAMPGWAQKRRFDRRSVAYAPPPTPRRSQRLTICIAENVVPSIGRNVVNNDVAIAIDRNSGRSDAAVTSLVGC